jgi:hypothetical protein
MEEPFEDQANGSGVQNEATEVSVSNAQNEATASPASSNLSVLNDLPAAAMQPPISRSARLNAAVEATLQNSANLRVRSVL